MTVFDNATRGIKLVGCAVSMEIAEATRKAAAEEGVPMSHVMRLALLRELKARGFFQKTEAA